MNSNSNDSELVQELIDAAVLDHPEAERLLSIHPELRDARYLWGETALHFLATENYPTGVRWLAEHGVDVNSPNKYGDTALSSAVTVENLPMVELLLELGADPNTASDTRGPPLLIAASKGNLQLVRVLLEAGAQRDFGQTSEWEIQFALERCPNREEILALLPSLNPHAGE